MKTDVKKTKNLRMNRLFFVHLVSAANTNCDETISILVMNEKKHILDKIRMSSSKGWVLDLNFRLEKCSL